MDYQIIHGNSIEYMATLEKESIDVIFADPPYNLQLENDLLRPNGTIVDGVNDSWDKFGSGFTQYDNFTKEWLKEAYRVLKPDGTIFIMGTYHSVYRVGYILQDIGYWILNDILWIKSNPLPNMLGTRLCNAHETIIWASKSKKSKFTFNYQLMKQLNGGKQLRSDWYFNVCSGKERILGNDGKKAHSTQKPLELLKRIVLMSSKKGDTILDPFMGTATSLEASCSLERKCIGIDSDIKSVDVAKKRMESVELDNDLLKIEENLIIGNKIQTKGFEELVMEGIIPVGTVMDFYKSANKPMGIQAIVLQNGKILYNNKEMSIHQSGKEILGIPSCNGWKHWYIKQGLDIISIDGLRH